MDRFKELNELVPRDGRVLLYKEYRTTEQDPGDGTDQLFGHIKRLDQTGVLVYTDGGDIVLVPIKNVKAVELFLQTGEETWV